MSSETVGSVAELWRFPVKSMKGEPIEQAELTARGLVGDRGYALIDVDTGKVVSAKSVKLFPRMLDCRAAFVEPPKSGGELPPVRITLPDSSTVTSDSSNAAQILSSLKRCPQCQLRADSRFIEIVSHLALPGWSITS